MAEQVNYEKLLMSQPTREEARYIWEHWETKDYLIYKHVWYREPITRLKREGVEVVCSKCRQSAIWAKYSGGCCSRSGGYAPFGVILPDGPMIGGQKTTCPECGAEVTLRHIGGISPVIAQWSYWCAMGRLGDKLVLYCWVAQRDILKDGSDVTSIKPYEAYVVEDRKVVRLKGYNKFMSSFRLTEEWQQVKVCHDTLGCVGTKDMLPWDPAILEGTAAEHSKLDMYMALRGEKFPVSYLRLFIRHPNVENLLMQGAGEFVAQGIRSEIPYYGISHGSTIPKLKAVNWKAQRPSQMLGLNRDEFGWFVRQQWTESELDLYKRLRARERVRLPDDIELFRQSEPWSVGKLIDEGHPVRRCIRYCVKQQQTVQYLFDYWNMARAEGVDLDDESLRFPKDLRRQHDRLVQIRNERRERENAEKRKLEMERRKAGFEKQAGIWSRLDFAADGILIRCCRNEEELIAEGKTLSHCVANYANSVSTGSSVILFIRREKTPDKPWFTLELDPKLLTVRQNRGKKNCDPPQEVKDFVALWIKTKIQKEENAA